MTREEYYKAIREEWAVVDKTDRYAIHNYNQWRNMLYKEMCEDEEKAKDSKRNNTKYPI